MDAGLQDEFHQIALDADKDSLESASLGSFCSMEKISDETVGANCIHQLLEDDRSASDLVPPAVNSLSDMMDLQTASGQEDGSVLLRDLDAPWNVHQSLEEFKPSAVVRGAGSQPAMETEPHPSFGSQALLFDEHPEVAPASVSIDAQSNCGNSESIVDGHKHSKKEHRSAGSKHVPIDPYLRKKPDTAQSSADNVSMDSHSHEHHATSFHNFVRYIRRRSGHHQHHHARDRDSTGEASSTISSTSSNNQSPTNLLGKILVNALEFRNRSRSLERLTSGVHSPPPPTPTSPTMPLEKSCQAVYSIYDKILKEGEQTMLLLLLFHPNIWTIRWKRYSCTFHSLDGALRIFV